MLYYITHRLFVMIPTLLIISALVFIIIQLPPGDYLSTTLAELEAQGEQGADQVAYYTQLYGLDKPAIGRYFDWLFGIFRGDLGHSFEYDLPVTQVVGDRMWLTFLISFSTILFVYIMAFPIGVYSAVRQYSIGDYSLTFIGFIGLAIPNFLLGLILLYLAKTWFGTDVGGLMDEVYQGVPMSWDKFVNILSHLWIPVVVVGTAGTASMIRRLRANLLDELNKQYFITAQAKGMSYRRALIKYPLRMALNPFIADIGNVLPEIVSGTVIVSIVLSLDTTGTMLYNALINQDTYLAGSFLLFVAVLTVMGTLVSDLALAVLDPRIRLTGGTVK